MTVITDRTPPLADLEPYRGQSTNSLSVAMPMNIPANTLTPTTKGSAEPVAQAPRAATLDQTITAATFTIACASLGQLADAELAQPDEPSGVLADDLEPDWTEQDMQSWLTQLAQDEAAQPASPSDVLAAEWETGERTEERNAR